MTGPVGERQRPDFAHEIALRGQGLGNIAGIDEAGRGPLAGPVVAAAVVLDPQAAPSGLNDSKLLTAARREALFTLILTQAVAVGIGLSPAEEIDRINIRQATFAAMRRAVAALPSVPAYTLIDGRDVPPELPCPGMALVKGDRISASISAASIVAKVVRDRLMARLDETYPAYGFATHAGYPTQAHREAIAAHGACPFHRMSFAPLRNR